MKVKYNLCYNNIWKPLKHWRIRTWKVFYTLDWKLLTPEAAWKKIKKDMDEELEKTRIARENMFKIHDNSTTLI